jgi:hypothetical protein
MFTGGAPVFSKFAYSVIKLSAGFAPAALMDW